MIPHLPYFVMNTVQAILGIVVLVLLIRTGELKSYWPLLAMATWQAPSYFVLMGVRFLGRSRIDPVRAYHLYFNAFWPAFGVSALCAIIFTYVLFQGAMRPLKGLQSLGNIVFTWVAVISLATTLSVAFAPGEQGADRLILVVSQLDRASSILIVSLVVFVAVAIRPMGLSTRSRIFGACMGTLIVATTNMMQATFLHHVRALYNPYALVQLTSSCVAQIIWIYYFARPEPKRKFILLPTTSPFHHWNRISELLGHEPGFVAIGGVPPESFSGAEIDIFRRASAKMKEVEDQRKETALLPH